MEEGKASAKQNSAFTEHLITIFILQTNNKNIIPTLEPTKGKHMKIPETIFEEGSPTERYKTTKAHIQPLDLIPFVRPDTQTIGSRMLSRKSDFPIT